MEQKDISSLTIEELKILHFDAYKRAQEADRALTIEKQNLLTIEATIQQKEKILQVND